MENLDVSDMLPGPLFIPTDWIGTGKTFTATLLQQVLAKKQRQLVIPDCYETIHILFKKFGVFRHWRSQNHALEAVHPIWTYLAELLGGWDPSRQKRQNLVENHLDKLAKKLTFGQTACQGIFQGPVLLQEVICTTLRCPHML
jgi:hypothetical protein